MLKIFPFILLFFVFTDTAFAQLNGFLTPGARSLGMGGTGLNAQDIYASWANPAGLSDLNATGFAFYGEQRFSLSELKQLSAAVAMPLGKTAGVALVLGYYGIDAYNEQRVGLAYGRKLSRNISMGAQLFTWNTRIPGYGNRALVSFEFGVQGQVSPQVSLAAKVINPVRVAVLEDEYLPTIMSMGLRYSPGEEVLILLEIEKDVLLPLRIRMGVEYRLLDALDLRIGLATSETQLSFGFGYRLKKRWQFNFAAAYHQYLGLTPGIGLVYR